MSTERSLDNRKRAQKSIECSTEYAILFKGAQGTVQTTQGVRIKAECSTEYAECDLQSHKARLNKMRIVLRTAHYSKYVENIHRSTWYTPRYVECDERSTKFSPSTRSVLKGPKGTFRSTQSVFKGAEYSMEYAENDLRLHNAL